MKDREARAVDRPGAVEGQGEGQLQLPLPRQARLECAVEPAGGGGKAVAVAVRLQLFRYRGYRFGAPVGIADGVAYAAQHLMPGKADGAKLALDDMRGQPARLQLCPVPRHGRLIACRGRSVRNPRARRAGTMPRASSAA